MSKQKETIYVRLLDEGTEVWRPVEAEVLPSGDFKLCGTATEGEQWEFSTGTVVVAENRQLTEGPVKVAVRKSSRAQT